MSERTPQEVRDDLLARRRRIREEMGSSDRIERQHAKGRLTIRERIDRLLDEGSFMEVGTFARSERREVRDSTPGDGKIGGWGTIDGRPVTVSGDDVTVLHGSSSVVGGKRSRRIFEQALTQGVPFIYFGETGGGRLPDALGSEGFSKIVPDLISARRARRIPVASAIVGESFGGSSFQ
ncbi:MAG: methylmalonyl-CoA carboxyltransferase, partial [Chloroflexi bacterium]|nr:methylmalonyl-CoA carboxyltransferase [Chloroflexota bacterium]